MPLRRHRVPPGPRLPAPAATVALARDPVGFLGRASRRYGETFSLRLLPPGRVVLTSAPAVLKLMIGGDPRVFRAGAATRCLLPVLGQRSLIVSDGEAHRRRRQALLPAFSPHGLEPWRDVIRRLAAAHVARWPRARPFALVPRARALAFEVVATVVGVGGRALAPELESRLARLSAAPVWPAVVAPALRRRLGGAGPWAAFDRRAAAIDDLLSDALKRRNGRSEPPTVADALLEPRVSEAIGGEPDVLEELRTLLLVGHETATAAIAWTLLALAHHPQTASDLHDESFAEAAIHEALRLHPPVVDVVREVAEPVEVGDWRMPAGTILVGVPPLVHRRPDLYADPDAFRPQRFLARRPDPIAWIPFGGGRRRCLGATLALMELATVVAAVAAAGRLRPAAAVIERARLSGTTLVPLHGGWVVLDA